ncbi:MAG: DUF721 domain-containing protein [Fimbriimonas sp.]
MKKVDKVLHKAVTHDEALRSARAQAALREWDEIVGEALAKRSRPDRYGRGTVWVACTGSAWAQEMRMRKETILQRLRERSGEPSLFIDIRFGVRPLPTRYDEDEGPPPPTSPPVESAEEEKEPEGERSLQVMSIREIAQRRLARMREGSEPKE